MVMGFLFKLGSRTAAEPLNTQGTFDKHKGISSSLSSISGYH
jgi:hypothetical protein